MSAEALRSALRELAHGGSLTADAAAAAFGDVMRGEGTPATVAALLAALRVKGETPDEVAGAARALREAMTVFDAPNPEGLVDTCGTGGGTVTTFNISTAAALVAAGAGVRIAKHGNRSFTSRSGSADVLEALGIPLDVPVARMADILAHAGIVFMFAPAMHPAMKHVGPVRRELAIPTVMNLVGPLANPARAGRQVVGVADPARLDLIAGALAALHTRRALIVHGAPGLDEVSPLGITRVIEVRGAERREWTIDPHTAGFAPVAASELTGGDPAENAAMITEILSGGGSAGARSAVLLNAAAAILVSGEQDDFAGALQTARDALARGAGLTTLERLRAAVRAALGQ
ncbi:MAG: anthranilate phosphoribosyltransferase [Gemmatimonadaceae bacterium]|nr:anthranilate phosphoribosyltransferase [Gemmatimonadaceae bacterium]